jgi:hypothetical protein
MDISGLAEVYFTTPRDRIILAFAINMCIITTAEFVL